MSASFARIRVEDWRQFEEVDLTFHPRLTIITGANASGKSTILGLLGRHFAWSRGYSSAPVRVRSADGRWTNLGRRRARNLSTSAGWAPIGTLTYTSGGVTDISVPSALYEGRQQYDLLMPEQQEVHGLYLTSHRSSVGAYTHVPTIPTSFAPPEQHFEQYTNDVRSQWFGGFSGRSPALTLKESLISAAIFGNRLNEAVVYSPMAADVWDGFQQTLGSLLPRSLRYKRLRVRAPDVVVETETGDFVIDDASGGLSAIVEIAWQIFLASRKFEAFTVLLDEPENHLHPSLQREIIPGIVRSFPNARLIVATHSPFVVTSMPESIVYALDYNDQRRVIARTLDYTNKAATADEVLQRVLGVPSTAPVWADNLFESILEKYMNGHVSTQSLRQMRSEMDANGLAGDFPRALSEIIDGSGEA